MSTRLKTTALLGLLLPLLTCDTALGQARKRKFMKPTEGVIRVTDYAGHVAGLGTDLEDWQPAFQAAIEAASKEIRPIYVPAGEYRIRKAIEILPVTQPQNVIEHNEIRLFGDGKYHSIISQQVATENGINWTGPAYAKPCNFGHLSHLAIRADAIGGESIGLNIKWHNRFAMDYVYIQGFRYGVHAEGWSSRFVNSTIRWCGGAGIYAGGIGTFNDCIIRDCYFSRDVVAFRMPNRGFGNRIEGSAFESCSKAAIYLGGGEDPLGVESFTISNCYFEQNGYTNVPLLPVEGPVSTIRLDHGCSQITIHDCNFFRPWAPDRKPGENKLSDCPLISIAFCKTGHIYDNLLNGAIQLSGACESPEGAEAVVSGLIVENNRFRDVAEPLTQDKPGLIERALLQNSVFSMVRRSGCKGSPVGCVRPQRLGDEIMDTETRTWYKAVGPKNTDWVPLH